MQSEWLTGPKFICEEKEHWPNLSGRVAKQIQVNRIDMKSTRYESFIARRAEIPAEVLVNFAESSATHNGQRLVLQFETCSRWTIYLRAIVRFRRAIEFWKKRLRRDALAKPIPISELLQRRNSSYLKCSWRHTIQSYRRFQQIRPFQKNHRCACSTHPSYYEFELKMRTLEI